MQMYAGLHLFIFEKIPWLCLMLWSHGPWTSWRPPPICPFFFFFEIDMVLVATVTWQRHPRDYPATFSQRLPVVARTLLVTCYQLCYGLGDNFLLFGKSRYLVITTAQGLHKYYPATCGKSQWKGKSFIGRHLVCLQSLGGWVTSYRSQGVTIM